MTKKNYNEAARLIREELPFVSGDEFNRTVNIFVKFFATDNPRFDEKRFRDACEIK